MSDSRQLRVVRARPTRSPALEALLDDAERARLTALRGEDDRRRFAASHALARLMLSQVTGLDPASVQIAARCRRCGGPHGKTFVVSAAHLHISLSHAGERVAVALSSLGPVGVDVEQVAASAFAGFADVALTAGERAEYLRLPAEHRQRAAATWWVRKEALLKATGHGMFVSPADVEVSAPVREPRLVAWHAQDGPTTPVHLVDLSLGPDYVGCAAVLSHRAPELRLTDGDELLAAWAGQVRTARR
ncbi:MAG TPA: 4'-phosphopantetheinyl transferase superfamily protein [Jatrophihabitans sp.]|nr:4'-phosphopantetheinyl transferase superfamily protein [Jatrophihabitans sp.]